MAKSAAAKSAAAKGAAAKSATAKSAPAKRAGKSIGLLCVEIHRRDQEAGVRRILGVLSLAKKHGAALLCITEKDSGHPSLGSLVSLRAEAVRTECTGDRFRCEVRVLKDKLRGPGWTHVEVCHGPDGLC